LKEPIAWKDATQKIVGASSSSEADLLSAISSKTTFKDADWWQASSGVSDRLWRNILTRAVGLFSDAKITPRGNPLDTLCALLEEKMSYEEGERDFVVSALTVPTLLLTRSSFNTDLRSRTRTVATRPLRLP
jgi:saccharopine dehydrogenase (NADP+, L-glutamate forming)